MAETWGLCGRCLVIVDVRTGIRAVKSGQVLPYDGNVFNPVALANWVMEHISSGYDIELNANNHMFDPVSTWHGDSVCQVHLWELREREMRGS